MTVGCFHSQILRFCPQWHSRRNAVARIGWVNRTLETSQGAGDAALDAG
jgi:hypothetical protein